MQAENTAAITLRSRALLPFPQAITLAAAFVASAVFASTHIGSLRAPWQDEAATSAAPARADHPFGALIFFSAEPPPSPARVPGAIARGPVLELDPGEAPTPEAAPQREAALDVAAPLPPRRPQDLGDGQQPTAARARRDAQQPVAAAPAPDNRGLFERIFNIGPKEQETALAYATPQDGAVGSALRGAVQSPSVGSMPMSYADGRTAVYDISAKTVFMPNGEKLEAHSGLGDLLDDPNRVHVKNRGATPPNVYDLSLREQLFHGVRALRLNPVDGSQMYGRDGMLAHTYMLGPKGDSNGCVSFKDYERFLNAYLNGEVKRLVVVQRRA